MNVRFPVQQVSLSARNKTMRSNQPRIQAESSWTIEDSTLQTNTLLATGPSMATKIQTMNLQMYPKPNKRSNFRQDSYNDRI